jgi:regulator of cell morphogenesis and NO signaling
MVEKDKEVSAAKVEPAKAVGQMAAESREFIPVFERLGINYYSEGSLSLEEACRAAGIPLEQAMGELEGTEGAREEWYRQERDWQRESMGELIDYIVHVHHVNTRLKLDHIEGILAKWSRDSQSPSKMGVVQGLFIKLDADLREHLNEEEERVFPYLIRAERSAAKGEPFPPLPEIFGDFNNSLRALLFEHAMMDREFKEISKLICLFGAGDRQWKSIGSSLELAFLELERDNQKHIHLENNILLKRAAQQGLLG